MTASVRSVPHHPPIRAVLFDLDGVIRHFGAEEVRRIEARHSLPAGSVIGYAKPDVRAFRHAVDALGLAPESVFFTDDSAAKLAGAVALGMPAHRFTDVPALRAALKEAGVP